MLPPRDNEGYLVDLNDWSESVAAALAADEGIELGDEHWALIRLIRDFYRDYQVSPAMRVLVKQVRERLGAERGNSIYLMQLFPGSPAKRLARIAGLPRPTNCL
ncbi:MAG: TusE/DsrC/DsvC family sulfur relay protein [Pseudomonadales bacterium]